MPGTTERPTRTSGDAGLVGAAVILAALNLRPAITSVGPLLDQARAGLGASAAWAGLVTTVPVLCFAGAGLAAPQLARRIGIRGALLLAIAALAAGLALRVLDGATMAVLATVLAASGIAVMGVLIPAVVRSAFPSRIGLVTGLYTAALQAGATAGFALTPLLAETFGGWRPAWAFWAAPALVALLVWLAVGRRHAGPPATAAGASSGRSLLGSPLAWTITAFFGLQAFVAFAVTGWMPLVLLDLGISRTDAGLYMGLLTIIALPVSLLIPPMVGGRGSQSGAILALGGCGFAGVLGMLVAPAVATLLWIVLLGLGMSVFSLALTTVALRARTAADTAQLSGMAQGLGYLVAAAGPFVFGTLREATGGSTASFAVLLAAVAMWSLAGAVAGRPGYVR